MENTCDRGNPIHRTNKSLIDWPLHKRYSIGNDNQRPREDSCRSNARNGPSNDQSNRCRCHSANQGSEFENGDCSKVDPFDGKEGIKLAKKELKGAGCEKICRTVPSYIVEGVELVRDTRYRCSNDCVVL